MAQINSLRHQWIAPSLLSADFAYLAVEIKKIEEAGAELLHLDIMDGHFVPNITMGPGMVETIHKISSLPLDCHLMIEDPEKYIDAFIAAGASMISVHCETPKVTPLTLQKLKKQGIHAGIAINPETELSHHFEFIRQSDYVLIMTVRPGFGGQKFMAEVIGKIKALADFRAQENLSFGIEVDGGVSEKNIGSLAEAGANIFVAGSAIFKSKNYIETIQKMRREIHV